MGGSVVGGGGGAGCGGSSVGGGSLCGSTGHVVAHLQYLGLIYVDLWSHEGSQLFCNDK